MHLIRPSPIPTREITDEALYLRRRELLRAGAAFSAAALLGCGEDNAANAATPSAPLAKLADRKSVV